MLACGRFLKTFGIAGKIKFHPYLPENLAPDELAHGVAKKADGAQGQAEPVKIVSATAMGRVWVLQIEGVNSPEKAKHFTNLELWVERSIIPALSDMEYFHHDIIGCRIFDEHGNELGVIEKIIETGANDIWQVARKGGGEILLPAIRDVVRSLDIKNKKVIVNLLEGLAEL